MKTTFALLSLSWVLLLAPTRMSAHHGNSAYNMGKIVELKGRVTEFIWANPHSILLFDVKDDKGNVTHWSTEAGSPSSLTARGWTRNSLQVGDEVTIHLWQSKSGTPVGRLQNVVFPDGHVLVEFTADGRPAGAP